MYKGDNALVLKVDKTYNRLSFKCTANTNICSCMSIQAACDYAACVGRDIVNTKLKEINKDYGVHIVSTKYSASKTYKFRGLNTPECVATVIFKITYRGETIGSILSNAIIQQIINKNDGKNVF